jgi:hypothetical protein
MSATIQGIRVDATAQTGTAIQKTIDQVAASGGGTVVIPAGTYFLDNAVHLRSGVHLIGEPGTILKKIPSVSSAIPDYLGYGHYEITVAEPEKFHVGMGIHVLDNHSPGFYTTVATIIGIEGERLFLDRMLNHDYHPGENARAVSAFSLLEADQVVDVVIENLVLDGNKAEETFSLNGCRGAGLFIYQSRRVAVRNVEIRNYRGDGLSFQQDIDITVDGCHLHHNTGGGLHPGSGSVRYILQGNRIHDNGGCGIFYCLRTTHSLCRDNLIENNAGTGISIGERDTDHAITGNTIRGQGGAGISFRPPTRCSGDRVVLKNNALHENCRLAGTAEIEIEDNLHWIHLEGNTITPAGKPAIRVGDHCSDIYIGNQSVSGHPLRPSDIAGTLDAVRFTPPLAFPAVGPDALPPNGALHLGVSSPGPCRL